MFPRRGVGSMAETEQEKVKEVRALEIIETRTIS